MIRMVFGRVIHKPMVSILIAKIGRKLYQDSQANPPNPTKQAIKSQGQKLFFAQFFCSLKWNKSVLTAPTEFMATAVQAPKRIKWAKKMTCPVRIKSRIALRLFC